MEFRPSQSLFHMQSWRNLADALSSGGRCCGFESHRLYQVVLNDLLSLVLGSRRKPKSCELYAGVYAVGRHSGLKSRRLKWLVGFESLCPHHMHECWNRQTGKLEVLVFFGACGFKSRLVHQLAIVPAPMR